MQEWLTAMELPKIQIFVVYSLDGVMTYARVPKKVPALDFLSKTTRVKRRFDPIIGTLEKIHDKKKIHRFIF